MKTIIARNMPYGCINFGTSMEGLRGYALFNRDYQPTDLHGTVMPVTASPFDDFAAWAPHAYWFDPKWSEQRAPWFVLPQALRNLSHFHDDGKPNTRYLRILEELSSNAIRHGFASDDDHLWWRMKWEGAK